MEIRQLHTADANEYLSIRLEALQDSPHAFASSYEEEEHHTAAVYKDRFATPANAFTFGAFEGSQLIGVVTLIREPLVKLSHRANIVAMYMKPEKRGLGLGKALISRTIEKAESLEGIEQINLSVVTTNIPAKKLYASCGFEAFGKEKRALKINHTYFDEEHMVLCIKK